ncbi:hypothetical protein [Parafrankia soli]|nr:hypothetical protein [Parafrankia soli]
MTPINTQAASTVPDGLVQLFVQIDEATKDGPINATTAAALFNVKPRTVVAWARNDVLSGVQVTRRAGWQFTGPDLKDCALRSYRARATAAA